MANNPVDMKGLRHSLGHVLGYVRAASTEITGAGDRDAAETLLKYAIERLEKALEEIDESNEGQEG